MKKYYYTTEYMGPMDGVHITYVNRYINLEKAKVDLENSDGRMITEDAALKMMKGEEWENDKEDTYCVLSRLD